VNAHGRLLRKDLPFVLILKCQIPSNASYKVVIRSLETLEFIVNTKIGRLLREYEELILFTCWDEGQYVKKIISD